MRYDYEKNKKLADFFPNGASMVMGLVSFKELSVGKEIGKNEQ